MLLELHSNFKILVCLLACGTSCVWEERATTCAVGNLPSDCGRRVSAVPDAEELHEQGLPGPAHC